MKILHLNDMAADTLFGGAEYNASSVIAALRSMGHEVEDCGMRPCGQGMASARLPDCGKLDHDVILLGSWSLIDPRWLLRALECTKAPLVLWMHNIPWCRNYSGECGGNVDAQHKGCRVPLYWSIISRATTVLCYSPPQLMRALATFGPPSTRDKYRILPIFCDHAEDFYSHRDDEREPGSVASVSRHGAAKGVHCYSIFARTNPKLGPFRSYGTYHDGVRELYKSAGIDVQESVQPADLPALLGRHEYFFHQPPQLDTGPRTIVEARLAGCKVVAARTCGYTEHPDWALPDEELVARCKLAPMAAAKAVCDAVA